MSLRTLCGFNHFLDSCFRSPQWGFGSATIRASGIFRAIPSPISFWLHHFLDSCFRSPQWGFGSAAIRASGIFRA
ncbi:MAG: hypothetical protein AAF442_02740, partial [Pseudomonadota bacterium]